MEAEGGTLPLDLQFPVGPLGVLMGILTLGARGVQEGSQFHFEPPQQHLKLRASH